MERFVSQNVTNGVLYLDGHGINGNTHQKR